MKIIFPVIAALLFAYASFGQVRWGIRGGPNFATVRYLNEDNSKARVGYHVGLLAEVPVQENLFVRSELLYSSKGFHYSASGFNKEGSVRLNYINLPILLGFKPTPNTALLAGPELGFLQKAVSRSDNFTTDMSGLYRKFDVGFDLGFVYYLNTSVGVEARYNYGFKDLVNTVITDNAGNITGQGKTGANSVIQLSLLILL